MSNFPIVILPGWLLSFKHYELLKQEFTKIGYNSYIVSFPGFADGPPLNRTLNLTDYVKFLKLYLKKHKINKAIFVCHSFGGRVVLKFLSQEPHKAFFLIISGTPGFVPVSKPKLAIFLLIAKAGGRIFSLPLLRKIKNLVRKIFYQLIGAKDFYHTEGFIRETFKNIIKEDLVNYMRKIKLPTLLIWGEKDKTVPVKIAGRMQKVIINSKLIIVPEMNHMFICNEPEVFVKNVMESIKQN